MELYRKEDNERLFLFATHHAWYDVPDYLGPAFNPAWCTLTDADICTEFQRYPDAATFYRETTVYCYNGLIYFLEGWKRKWYAHLFNSFAAAGRGISILDYGCGSGCDGLFFLEAGFKVGFADVESRSLDFLRWRLRARRATADIHVLPSAIDGVFPAIPPYAVVWCMGVLEHLPAACHASLLLDVLPRYGHVVFAELVHDVNADGTVHHQVDYDALTEKVRAAFPSLIAVEGVPSEDGSFARLLIYGDAVN